MLGIYGAGTAMSVVRQSETGAMVVKLAAPGATVVLSKDLPVPQSGVS